MPAATGQSYYVSSSQGDDSNSGLYPWEPWKSIDKVNSYWSSPGFNPGDQILFLDGDTFYGYSLVAQTGGNSINPIVIGRYGNKFSPPVFDGAYPTSAGDWVRVGTTNQWQIDLDDLPTTPSNLSWVYFGAVLGARVNDVTDLYDDFQYHYDSSTHVLTVWVSDNGGATNPVTWYGSVRPQILDFLIQNNYKGYITIRGLKLKHWSTGSAVNAGIYLVGTGSEEGLKVEYCEFDNEALFSVIAHGDAIMAAALTYEVRHCTFTRCYRGVYGLSGNGTVDANTYMGCMYGMQLYNAAGANGTITYSNNRYFGLFSSLSSFASSGGSAVLTDGGSNALRVIEAKEIRKYSNNPVPINISIDGMGEFPEVATTIISGAIAEFKKRGDYAPSIGVVPGGTTMGIACDHNTVLAFQQQGAEICSLSWSHSAFYPGYQEHLIQIAYVPGSASTATITVASGYIASYLDGVKDLQFTLSEHTIQSLADAFMADPNYFAYRNGYTADYSPTIGKNCHASNLEEVTDVSIYNSFAWFNADETTFYVDEIKSAHDWFVASGITEAKVFFYPWGYNVDNHATWLADSSNGAYEIARNAGLALYPPGEFGRAVFSGSIASVRPYRTYATMFEDTSISTYQILREDLGNIVAFSQITGMPHSILCHPAYQTNANHAEHIGWMLDVVLEFGSYATMTELNTYIRSQHALSGTSEPAYVIPSGVVDVDLDLESGTNMADQGISAISPYTDIKGRDTRAGACIGAYEYYATPTITAPTKSEGLIGTFKDLGKLVKIYDQFNECRSASDDNLLETVDMMNDDYDSVKNLSHIISKSVRAHNTIDDWIIGAEKNVKTYFKKTLKDDINSEAISFSGIFHDFKSVLNGDFLGYNEEESYVDDWAGESIIYVLSGGGYDQFFKNIGFELPSVQGVSPSGISMLTIEESQLISSGTWPQEAKYIDDSYTQ